MTSKEAKTHIIDTLNGDMNKEYFINELLPEILKDLERLEEIENLRTTPNALETCLANYMNKCIDLENENQELKDDITKTYSEFGFSNLSDFRKEMRKIFIEYQELKEWCLILNKHLYIAPEMCELRMATPKNADFLIKNSRWTKYYNGIDVHEIDYKKFVDLYYSKIKEVLCDE